MTADLYWTPNTEADLAYYNVYYGNASGVYTTIRIETNTTHTISGLLDAVPYYFAVTAVDTSGNESGFSAEVSKINKRVKRLRVG
jgi:fibronectin type 3 domain-containing protein